MSLFSYSWVLSRFSFADLDFCYGTAADSGFACLFVLFSWLLGFLDFTMVFSVLVRACP